MGNRTHILSERLKAATEFKRLKKGHRPAPMPPTWTHILSYKPPAAILDNKKGPQMGPFFKVILAESWGFEPQMPFWGILA